MGIFPVYFCTTTSFSGLMLGLNVVVVMCSLGKAIRSVGKAIPTVDEVRPKQPVYPLLWVQLLALDMREGPETKIFEVLSEPQMIVKMLVVDDWKIILGMFASRGLIMGMVLR